MLPTQRVEVAVPKLVRGSAMASSRSNKFLGLFSAVR